MASSDTDDDVILIPGVLLAGAFLNQCKKKADKLKRSIWSRRWIEQRDKHGTYHSLVTKRKVNKSTIDQSAVSVFRNLLHRLEQVAIQIWVAELVAQLSSSP